MALDSPAGAVPESPFAPPNPPHPYPVNVLYQRPENHKRFWAIPILGIVVKLIILIPHLIVLEILNFVASAALIILWIPVLLGGKYPEWGYALMGGWLRWTTRVSAYLLGLTDEYPPFTFRSSSPETARVYQVQVQVDIPPRNSRGWAFPVLGYAIKLLLLIPHLVILTVMGSVSGVLALVTWIPVLFGEHYPDWGYLIIGGTLRWGVRVTAYLDGLTDRYPPFSFE
jgi:uncharacterized protein DUF4389